METWEALDPKAEGLVEARLVLHHAVQLVAAVGQSLAEKAPDDSQQSVTVDGARRWLGVPLGMDGPRAGLDPVALELRLHEASGHTLARLPLAGRTLDEGLDFLRGELARRGRHGPLTRPVHPADFPHHPLADGARFPPPAAPAYRTLAQLFAGTASLLDSPLGAPAGPVRLWPHHFDLSATFTVGRSGFGLGVSPGDGQDGRPYWYATPPGRLAGALPPLEGGATWRREGWFGAELPLERLGREPPTQREQVGAFFRSFLVGARHWS